MDPEESVVQAEAPAPEQEVTAIPDPVASSPEVAPDEPAPKTFTQEELDAIIGKRLSVAQRKWEREQALRAASQPTPASQDVPQLEQFDSPEAYADALAEHKAQELIAKREAEKQWSEVIDAYHEHEEEARDKYEDFEQVAYNPKLRITEAMAQTIQSSEIGPEIAYYLGSNPKEADRISKLTLLAQAKEIGRIEAKLADNPPVKKVSSAPAPIAPVNAARSPNSAYDTTDPRSIKTMSTSEWIEAERQRQRRKYEAQRNH